jgi:hypothetical protein
MNKISRLERKKNKRIPNKTTEQTHFGSAYTSCLRAGREACRAQDFGMTGISAIRMFCQVLPFGYAEGCHLTVLHRKYDLRITGGLRIISPISFEY